MAATPTSTFGTWSSEQLILCRDDSLGLRAAIAIDDTTLGNGFGGVRFKSYPSAEAGITEAQRLARAMTYKNAAAGLDYGGAKSVLFAGPDPVSDRPAFMRRYGQFIARTGSAYMPGVDMGTTTDDLKWMIEGGAEILWVDDDPSPATATGVLHSIRAAVATVQMCESLADIHIFIQGVGHVGESLARDLAKAGARLSLADTDRDRVETLAAEVGAKVIVDSSPAEVDCDVFAPCAIARVVDQNTAERLKCRVVAGAANDTLSDDSVAQTLKDRGIVYVPDFLANAGGVIDVDGRHRGKTDAERQAALADIGERVRDVLGTARDSTLTTVQAAQQYALRRIEAARLRCESAVRS